MTEDPEWARLARYFAGECSSEEAEETRRWIEADPDRRRTADRLRAVWDAAARPATRWDTAASWKRLAARLHSRGGRDGPAVVRRARTAEFVTPGRRPMAGLAAAAAAALTVAGGVWWWSAAARPDQTAATPVPLREVRVPLGERARFQLTDGTLVQLAPGSTLRYDTAAFGESTRELQLDGRAYFTVTDDPRRPFVVHTARTVTEDLGTEFVITDYAADPTGEVVVASGTVAVRSVRADTARPAMVLGTGELVRLDTAGRATVRRGVDLQTHLAWTEGRLVFANTPVAEVVTQISRWYGTDVRLGDPAFAAHRFTASYLSESDTTVVRELATAIGATVRRRGSSTILISRSDRPREN